MRIRTVHLQDAAGKVDSRPELLKGTAQGSDAAEVQVGVGANTGVAYVGAVALQSTWSSPCLPTPSM